MAYCRMEGIVMNEYGKIFRRKQDNNFSLRSYNPDKEKYFELIQTAKEDNYTQLIINSELMINLMYTALNFDGIILNVSMSDTTDQDIKDNIRFILQKIRQNNLYFSKLKEELEWAIDCGSLDIESVDLYYENNKSTIKSNGIIYGKNKSATFNNLIVPVLESYFNGE